MFIHISEFLQAKETISPHDFHIFYRYTHGGGNYHGVSRSDYMRHMGHLTSVVDSGNVSRVFFNETHSGPAIFVNNKLYNRTCKWGKLVTIATGHQ